MNAKLSVQANLQPEFSEKIHDVMETFDEEFANSPPFILLKLLQ